MTRAPPIDCLIISRTKLRFASRSAVARTVSKSSGCGLHHAGNRLRRQDGGGAEGRGIAYNVGKFPFTANGRAKSNQRPTASSRFLADAKTDRVLGAHIVGMEAGEMIHECTILIEFGGSSEDLARTCHAHPTRSEAVKEAAMSVAKRAIQYVKSWSRNASAKRVEGHGRRFYRRGAQHVGRGRRARRRRYRSALFSRHGRQAGRSAARRRASEDDRRRLGTVETLSPRKGARDDAGRHDRARARRPAECERDRAVDGADEQDRGGRHRGGVVIAQAGVPLQRVQERVAQDGFMFPLDLGARGSCTIGGNISTNAGGNRVIRYGMTRDIVLGLEAVLADGTVLKGVRKYIKNNTGIDLKQLFIGTEGTLGVVTRAALRIFPAPAEQQVALCALPSFDAVRDVARPLAQAARRRADRLRGDVERYYYGYATELVKGVVAPLPAGYPFYILMESSGSDAERSAPILKSCSRRRWAKHHPRRHDCELGRRGRSDLADSRFQRRGRPRDPRPASAPTSASPSTGWSRSPTRSKGAIKKVDKDAVMTVLGHAGDGNLHVNGKSRAAGRQA